ncbi:hypothetical protein Cgig2_003393 [Carnegiea gigantea]|uniref:Alpha/beta hydrolase fold-3 domain-containing protein n=1 Tax=Carnegiea gigantea TaxID=171969 RepID=A0A9Q1JPZ4_9CARY|nr:hypothetical protein Cgig2_003393 [Carnegiea gigantea]
MINRSSFKAANKQAPEYLLLATFDDTWVAIQWVAPDATGDGLEGWLNEELARLNIIGCSLQETVQVQPWSVTSLLRLVDRMVDRWWLYVCPSNKGCDDPLNNPFANGASGVHRVICERGLVLAADNDVLKDRGRLYYDAMPKKREKGKVEFYSTHGKDHVFHVLDPGCDEAIELRRKVASFIS